LGLKNTSGLALIDVDSPSTKIPVCDGAVIGILGVGGGPFNIEAQTTGSIGSVKFGHNGNASFRTENTVPCAFVW